MFSKRYRHCLSSKYGTSIQLHNKFWENKVGPYPDIKGTVRLYFCNKIHLPELSAVLCMFMLKGHVLWNQVCLDLNFSAAVYLAL